MHVIATSAGARTRRRRSGVGWGGVLTLEDRALLERAPGSSCVALLRGIPGRGRAGGAEAGVAGAGVTGRRERAGHRKTRESGSSFALNLDERVILWTTSGPAAAGSVAACDTRSA